MLNATFLPLDHELVRLRPMRHEDASAYAEGTRDPDVRRFAHLPEPEYTASSVAAMIDGVVRDGLERGDLAVLAIADASTDAFAGSLVLFDITSRAAEVGFWLLPQFRGAGRAGSALDLACQLAQRSGLVTLMARTATDNHGSQRVLVGAGFVETGRQPDVAPSGEAVDLVHYARDVGAPRRLGVGVVPPAEAGPIPADRKTRDDRDHEPRA